MRRFVLPVSLMLLAGAAARAAEPIHGFTETAAAAEHQTEATMMSQISPARISDDHLVLTAEPHRAGSPRNNKLADWVADQWRQQGWDQVTFRKYDVYFTDPRAITLEMTAPKAFRASLHEDPIPGDPSTQRTDLPGGYNAYSASGDATAEVVYAHGGNPDDFALLRAEGISLKGKIVLVRYSYPYSFRGFKVRNAERAGAVGVILYSDPAEDGSSRGPVYPDGPWGNDSHVQRGFTAYAPIAPGDPTTPGWASVPGARHLTPAQTNTLPRIMVTSISARDARPLLENMTGPAAPASWQGGLPITYRMTGGVRAHLKIDMSAGLKTITNVEARIEGSEHPEQIVLIGNHRDAWVFGGADPSSGTASMMELTRALGALKKAGWRPKRTIMIANWDGEEEGLLGSTEWAEQYADTLQKNLVAYLNVDTSIFGAIDPKTGKEGPSLGAYSVASLNAMIVEASHDVDAPDGSGTLYEAWRRTRRAELPPATALTDAKMIDTGLDASSDHTAFILHLGRPVLGLTYGGAHGNYHSIYDDRAYMERFGDPGWKYSATIARFWGVLGLRLADADVLPFDYVTYADTISQGVATLEAAPGAAQHLDLAGLKAKVADFHHAAEHAATLSAELTRVTSSAPKLDDQNRRLLAVESGWADDKGLPGRPWSRHLIYGMKMNFSPLMLPGLTEAIERKDWPGARDQLRRLEGALQRNTELLGS
jgi:N-acetylated-alpha-linked acidic dipeptidase